MSIITIVESLYVANDNKKLPEPEREAAIIAKGLQGGIEFSFVD